MYVRTKFVQLLDDELLDLALTLESPLVKELASRLDTALDTVFKVPVFSDELRDRLYDISGTSENSSNLSIVDLVESLCKRYELLSAQSTVDKTAIQITCPGCLHSFNLKLDLDEK